MKPDFIYRGYELVLHDASVIVLDWYDYCVDTGESGRYGSLSEAMDAINEHIARYGDK